MSKKIEDKILNGISKILNVKNRVLIDTDDFTKFEEWDSLKHLEVITLLDKIIGKKIKKIKNISQITKLKKILALAKK
jgi:acyl carrier protein|tara:strand:+ start:909 stop:1142 length:234 start_codon:yes stop_codon:yes gene_type:complete